MYVFVGNEQLLTSGIQGEICKKMQTVTVNWATGMHIEWYLIYCLVNKLFRNSRLESHIKKKYTDTSTGAAVNAGNFTDFIIHAKQYIEWNAKLVQKSVAQQHVSLS